MGGLDKPPIFRQNLANSWLSSAHITGNRYYNPPLKSVWLNVCRCLISWCSASLVWSVVSQLNEKSDQAYRGIKSTTHFPSKFFMRWMGYFLSILLEVVPSHHSIAYFNDTVWADYRLRSHIHSIIYPNAVLLAVRKTISQAQWAQTNFISDWRHIILFEAVPAM